MSNGISEITDILVPVPFRPIGYCPQKNKKATSSDIVNWKINTKPSSIQSMNATEVGGIVSLLTGVITSFAGKKSESKATSTIGLFLSATGLASIVTGLISRLNYKLDISSHREAIVNSYQRDLTKLKSKLTTSNSNEESKNAYTGFIDSHNTNDEQFIDNLSVLAQKPEFQQVANSILTELAKRKDLVSLRTFLENRDFSTPARTWAAQAIGIKGLSSEKVEQDKALTILTEFIEILGEEPQVIKSAVRGIGHMARSSQKAFDSIISLKKDENKTIANEAKRVYELLAQEEEELKTHETLGLT